MKKTFLALGLFVAGGLTTFAATSTSFPDVSESDWFYKGVQYSNENGLMTGYDNKKFGPNDVVNRAQLATILERMDAGKINQMYWELRALRRQDIQELKGGSWETYKNEFWRFPVEGIQIIGEGSVSYDMVKDRLKITAIDNKTTIKLLTDDLETNRFFLEIEGMMGGVFGPFHDDVDRIVNEIEASNAK